MARTMLNLSGFRTVSELERITPAVTHSDQLSLESLPCMEPLTQFRDQPYIITTLRDVANDIHNPLERNIFDGG